MSVSYSGLTSREVVNLRKIYGFNEVPEEKESFLIRFFKKVTNPITLMIEFAFILSLLAKKVDDSFIIFLLLIVNLGVDLWQEQKAGKAIEALKSKLAIKAYALRDGKFVVIPARELVPGDIIKVGIGDVVPADIEVLEEDFIKVDQSNVTGESLLVEKHKGDTIYTSSIIQNGNFLAKVVKTGKESFIGKSVQLVEKAEEEQKSHFQRAIIRIGKFLAVVAIVLIISTSIYLFLKGDSLMEIVHFALVLAVASIPVALPAVLSVTMAIGAASLSKKRAIVSDPKALEELAGVSVLCVDKTGTLTKNEISVHHPKVYGNFSQEDLFLYAVLSSERVHQDNLDRAIERYAKAHHFLKKLSRFTVERFIPFRPETKQTVAFVREENGNRLKIIKGAPQVIEKIVSLEAASSLHRDVQSFAENGLRTLALALERNGEVFLVGVIPLFDPPREDSKQLIESLQGYGLNVKMVTGDNVAIARYVAKLLGLKGRVVRATSLSKFLKETKTHFLHTVNVFAEVLPEHKYEIVESLQREGNIVAMTGDGVNDAPAIKKADIGIAVAGATDAARSAADLVLLDPGLSAIKIALEYARQIFSRMQSYAMFRIAETLRIVFFITLAIFIFGFPPLPAIMVVLLALLNDIPVMAIAYDNAPISPTPVRWNLRKTLTVSTALGISGVGASLFLLAFLVAHQFPQEVIYTLMFLKLDVSGHSTLYTTRTGKKHFWQRPFPSLKFFLPAFGSRMIGTLLAYFGIFMAPISIPMILGIWGYGTVLFLINDQIKVFLLRKLD